MSDGPLSPEEVAHRGFGTTFRGFDTGEVRSYLQRVANDLRASTARERDLHRRLADAEHRAAHPTLEGDALTRALGDEMGRILASAQAAANGLKEKAEENSARILREAHDQAQRIRAQAEAILAMRTAEAEAEAAEIRKGAVAEATGVVERARREAAGVMAEVEGQARQLVHDAQAARARVLGDLTRRRRLLQLQVEQLRAGRDRLLEAYRMVRSTTDEVADELQRVEDEARDAAGAAAERVAAEPVSGDLDDVLAVFPGARPDAVAAGDDGPGAGPAEATGPGAGPAEAGGDDAPRPPAPAPAATVEVKAEVAVEAAGAPDSVATPAEAEAAAPARDGVGTSPDRSPQVVSTRPEGAADRRPLRLLRRHPKLDVVPDPPGDEGVRIMASRSAPAAGAGHAIAALVGEARSEPETEVGHEQAEPPEVSAGVDAGPPPSPPDRDDTSSAAAGHAADPTSADAGAPGVVADDVGVDELFARIRAGRADAVARAHEVLAADPAGPVRGSPSHPPAPAPDPAPAGAGGQPAGPAREETLLRLRDSAVEGIEERLARRLKRALQDEQNEVLDRLRSSRPGAGPDAVLLALDVQAARYRQAAGDLLRESAAAGVAFAGSGEGAPAEAPDVAEVVADLAGSLAEPLRRALERALTADGTDQGVVVERIGAAYRECKAQRIEGLAGDAVTAAFSRGALAAMPPGAASVWVVDDDGRPCPDCDDNALAGPTPAGEAFPTGQPHPPAHSGCRCLLVPGELAAAVPGAG